MALPWSRRIHTRCTKTKKPQQNPNHETRDVAVQVPKFGKCVTVSNGMRFSVLSRHYTSIHHPLQPANHGGLSQTLHCTPHTHTRHTQQTPQGERCRQRVRVFWHANLIRQRFTLFRYAAKGFESFSATHSSDKGFKLFGPRGLPTKGSIFLSAQP